MVSLITKLKTERQRRIARAQDIIVKTVFEVFSNNVVLHGGTSIWRCYNGNRFSEDIDVYIPRNLHKIETFFQLLEKRGLVIERKKISENNLFSTLKFERTEVRFEAIFKKMSGILKEYQTFEGNLEAIYTLPQEELIKEKISAYLNRFIIRDLYDVFFLLRYVQNASSILPFLKKLIDNFDNPKDESNLGALILSGITPKSTEMIEYIKDRIKNG
ncbi:nucleotidyl transferase AbiEii/AbiGii toxin family protein [Candidatus Pacearchaeota archaeon]|nr:nucleotidyl transferase AbiEii/AbiGii toxin family protein [Candidatus Pacearchaeota archaeon]